jgi:hypothetical protein
MIQTTVDQTRPARECGFVQIACPVHGMSSTVTQRGLSAVICFPCSMEGMVPADPAAEHARQSDPWCSANLCDHWPAVRL